MPNTKPKAYRGNVDIPCIPPDAINQIIYKTEIKLDEHQKKHLEKISVDYIVNRELLDEFPRLSENKAAIKKVLPKAEQLLAALESVDLSTNFKIFEQMHERSKNGSLYSTIETIRSLVFTLEDLLSELPADKGGRDKTTVALCRYIKNLAVLFHEVTDITPTASAPNIDNYSKGSPFFHFVSICLEALKHPPDTGFSLQHAIQRALS